MKNKTTTGIWLQAFIGILAVVAFIIGTNYIIGIINHKKALKSLQAQSEAMAGILSALPWDLEGQPELSDTLKLLSAQSGAEIWIVDKKTLQMANSGDSDLSFYDLPPNAFDIIDKAFSGIRSESRFFKSYFNVPTISYGAPVFDNEDTIIGALFVHHPDYYVFGLPFLIWSFIAVGLCLIAGLVYYLILRKTLSPLNRLNEVSSFVLDGIYTTRTGLHGLDNEFVQIAEAVDSLQDKVFTAQAEINKLYDEKKGLLQELEQLRGSFKKNNPPPPHKKAALPAEFQNPLQNIPEENHLGRQIEQGRELQWLVNHLYELAYLQNRDHALQMSVIDLCDVIDDISWKMRQALPGNYIFNVYKECAKFPFLGNYEKIRRMLQLLIEWGTGYFQGSSGLTIRFTVNADGDGILMIEIAGVHATDMEASTLFDQFYLPPDIDGMEIIENHHGEICLAISREIAKRHQVIIDMDSEQKESIVFSLMFWACARQI